MAEVPDDQLTAWADQVHIAASWVSGTHRKKLIALAHEITAWGNPEAVTGQPSVPEAPSLASGPDSDDDEDLVDEQ